jgi:hypothetical protein
VRVAIAQVDGKWPNLALAKIAAYHRARGDSVEWFSPLAHLDRRGCESVYASKVFKDTVDDPYLPLDTVCGGSGYSLDGRLLPEIERMKPDWSLWPTWPHDMGFSTRGCVRKCPFCIVPEKEGPIRVVAEFGDLTTYRKTMKLLDGNVTAAPIEHFRHFCDAATASRVEIEFNQGLDARLLTDEHAAIIARSKFARYIHLAFDHVGDEAAVRHAIATMQSAGVPASRLMFFVLVGFDTTKEEDMYRIELLRSLGCYPFVMPFDRHDRYQRDLTRWCNKYQHRNVTWAEYRKVIAA